MINSSFKFRDELFQLPPTFFPHNPTVSHYIGLFVNRGFGQFISNSLIVALSTTALCLIIGTPAAYSLSRFNLPFSLDKFFVVWILISRMFPPIAFVIPLFQIMLSLNLVNTIYALILAYIVLNLPLTIWIIMGFFQGIPVELEECAMIDGATRVQALVRVVVPLVAPGVAAAAIFSLIYSWNEFIYALIFVQTPAAKTFPVAISGLITEYKVLWGPMSAAGTISIIPILAFVIFAQQYLVKGLTGGAID
ncbi:MAG: carbohydrate ABC transporter permease [Candidatus Bipolaricaulia bacterium]